MLMTDNRFEVINRAKKALLDSTNIEQSPDEMKVLNDFLFRCWQMGWLDKYDDACIDNIVEKLVDMKHPEYNLTLTEYAYNMGLDAAINVVRRGAK